MFWIWQYFLCVKDKPLWETGLEPKLSVEYGLMKGMELSLKATMDLDLGHQQGME